MAVRNILKIGDPALRKVSEPVPLHFLQEEPEYFQEIIRDLFDTQAVSAGAVGLAAPQIGVLLRMFVTRSEVVINPEIEIQGDETKKTLEGCLSIPGKCGVVSRPACIRVTYCNEKGEAQERVLEGFDAVVFQHETDHLNGILYTDKI